MNLVGSERAPSRWLVACLCADWCDTCRVYRTTLGELAELHPETEFAWIDIEDDSELTGNLDIEDFPTLLVLEELQVRFFGTLLPHAGHLSRLLESILQGSGGAKTDDPAVIALAHALRRKVDAIRDESDRSSAPSAASRPARYPD
jgi:thioredoxin 1